MHSTDLAPGTVYLIHFDTPYRHARHYTGWTTNLDARLQAHRDGRGARLMEVITTAGITWQLARTWPGGRDRERAIKDRHDSPRLCPICVPHPRPAATSRALIAAASQPASPPKQPVQASPRDQGVHMAWQFLDQHTACTVGQLSIAYEQVVWPYLEMASPTAEQAEQFGAFTRVVTGRIALLSALEGANPPREDL
jgi:predicted GIY-YIG superfamily endonuclease